MRRADARFWEVPSLWPGETVCIFGGGPSLNIEQIANCRASGHRTIAINDAYRLAPWADLLYFCDERWWSWHRDNPIYRAFAGLKVTLENLETVCKKEPTVKSVQNLGSKGFSDLPWAVFTGNSSGYQTINLAAHLGVARIILLGFDLRINGKAHWFGDHPIPTKADDLAKMRERFPEALEPLKKRGITVINTTPESALKCFPMMLLERALADAPRRQPDPNGAALSA